MEDNENALTEVIEELEDAARDTGGDQVEAGNLIDALDERGYGPALAVLPLIELTPLGGIPGFPTVLAIVLAALTLRFLMGYEHFWAPDWLRKRKLKTERVIKSTEWLKPISMRIDETLHERLSQFTGPMAQRVAGIVILCLLLTVPPLEVVPFATSAPMIVVSIFGMGILFRDGLLMLLAFIGAALALGFGLWTLMGSGGF